MKTSFNTIPEINGKYIDREIYITVPHGLFAHKSSENKNETSFIRY